MTTSTTAPQGIPSPNTGKMMTKRIQDRDRTTVILTYSRTDANDLRMLAQSVILKAGKKPSLSLFARRALQVYGSYLRDASNAANETAVLNRMVTPVPAPAAYSKKKAPMSQAERSIALSALIGLDPGCDAGRSE